MSIKIKNKKGKKLEKELAQKMSLFDKTPSCCLACETPFDKKNREMAMTWYVIVRKEKKEVNLYCPPCWEAAKKITEEVKNGRIDP